VIDRIRNVKIPIGVQCHCGRVIQGRVLGRSAIAAEAALANQDVQGREADGQAPEPAKVVTIPVFAVTMRMREFS
jgi:hypothetical protein